MGPTSGKDSRQLYGGSGNYSGSERASAGVRAATSNQVKSNQVVGESGGKVSQPSVQEKVPKQNVGGTPPSEKQQAAARYNQPSGSSVNDEKA